MKFHGGVHPFEGKDLSNVGSIQKMPIPERLVLSLSQGAGNAAKPIVVEGERVFKNQLLARADGWISAAIHAPTSGVIEKIGLYAHAHPSGLAVPSIVLKSDFEDLMLEKNPRSTVEKFQKSPQSSKIAAKMAEKSTAKKTIAAAPSVITPKKAVPTNPAFIDFGGSVQATSIDIGKVKSNERAGFFIRQAEAATSIVDNCIEDSYRQAHGVKSLANGATQYKTNDFLPGLYGTSWSDTVNGHLVAITNVAVLRDGGAPVGQPNLLVYKDYQPNKKAQPTFRNQPKVNAYQGQKGVLYRVFVEGKNAPMQCIDLVLNKGAASPQSNLRYIKEGKIYQAPFAPSLAKR